MSKISVKVVNEHSHLLEICNQANKQMSKWIDASVNRVATVKTPSESGEISIVSLCRAISL